MMEAYGGIILLIALFFMAIPFVLIVMLIKGLFGEPHDPTLKGAKS